LASLTFTDLSGAATLDNGLTTIADGLASRFSNWVPFQRPIGPMGTSLGTGRGTRFIFRTDFGASFSIRELPNTAMPTMLRLQAHLLAGGLVTVTTGDATNRTYTDCCLAPDGDVTIEMQDTTLLTYTMNFTLLNLGGAAMLCEY
jgi:hypothetical protein